MEKNEKKTSEKKYHNQILKPQYVCVKNWEKENAKESYLCPLDEDRLNAGDTSLVVLEELLAHGVVAPRVPAPLHCNLLVSVVNLTKQNLIF